MSEIEMHDWVTVTKVFGEYLFILMVGLSPYLGAWFWSLNHGSLPWFMGVFFYLFYYAGFLACPAVAVLYFGWRFKGRVRS